MRGFIVVVFSLLILSCHSDVLAQADQTGIKRVNVQDLEKEGFAAFQAAPGEAIPVFNQVAIAYLEQENLPKAAITYLNIANIYDEYLEQTDIALLNAEKSLALWQKQNDTMQMANLYKYIGLLKGRLGAFAEAGKAIQEAITMYEQVGFEQGVAVSKINLAEVHLTAANYPESESMFLQSNAFWKQNGDLSRVFTNNILGIKLYMAMGDNSRIQALIADNKSIMEETGIDEFNESRFQELLQEINGHSKK